MLKEQIAEVLDELVNHTINCLGGTDSFKAVDGYADQILALFPQGEGEAEELVWYCTEKGNCNWQGFALNRGLAWGEKKNVSDAWLKYHSEFCKGRLIQGAIVGNQSKQAALKEQMERVIGVIEENMEKLTSQINTYQCPQQVPTAYLAQLYALKALKTELEGENERD